jgi:hypothetical protein
MLLRTAIDLRKMHWFSRGCCVEFTREIDDRVKIFFTLILTAIIKGPIGTNTRAKHAISDKKYLCKLQIIILPSPNVITFLSLPLTLQSNVGQCLSVYGCLYQYSENNVMHFLFNLLRIKGLYMFRALLAHPQEALHKRYLIYCVRVMSVGCTRIEASASYIRRTPETRDRPIAWRQPTQEYTNTRKARTEWHWSPRA